MGPTQPPEPWFHSPVLEADLLPTYSTEVKNEWSYTCVPRICLHDNVYRDSFTFTDLIEISTFISLILDTEQFPNLKFDTCNAYRVA